MAPFNLESSTDGTKTAFIDYSLRGIIKGTLSSQVLASHFVGVLCIHKSCFPAWIFILSSALYTVEWVVLHKDSLWIDLVWHLKPDIEILFDVPVSSKVTIVFNTGAPPGISSSIWTNAYLHTLVATNTPRKRLQDPWRMYRIDVLHNEVGGVSDGTFRIFIFSLHTLSGLEPTHQPKRDVSSIIDPTTLGGTVAPPNPQSSMKHPSIRRTACGVLSTFGLFPLLATKQKFLVPSVFSSTKWVHRRLSPHEILHVHDVPLRIIKLLGSADIHKLQRCVDIPFKVLVSVVSPVLRATMNNKTSTPTHGVCITGGDCSLPTNNKLDNLTSSSSTVPVSNAASLKGLVEQEAPHDTSKATKSDDAAIPMYIWDHRISKCPTDIRALNVLRAFFLCWWKRHLTKSFFIWLYSPQGTCCNLKRKNVKDWVVWNRKKKCYGWSTTGQQGYLNFMSLRLMDNRYFTYLYYKW